MRTLSLLGLLSILTLGCAHEAAPAVEPTSSSTPLPPATGPTGVGLLGAYDFAFDPADNTVALLPRHQAQLGIGDNLTVDLSGALMGDLLRCSECLTVTSIDRTTASEDELVTLTFRVRHPFTLPFEPESRSDLHVNNVRLALAIEGGMSFFGNSPEHPAVTTRPELWAGLDLLEHPACVPTAETSALLGTQVFATGDPLDPDGNYTDIYGWGIHAGDPSGFNVLQMGGEATTELSLHLQRGATLPLRGQLYLLGNFTINSENYLTRHINQYYMPEGAMLEPWRVRIRQLGPITDSADTTIEVEVCDWQAGATVDVLYPNPVHKRGLKAPSDVAAVWLDVPGFYPSGPLGPATSPVRGTGMPADPYVYEFTVRKPVGAPGGRYPACAKVLDERQLATGLDTSLNATTGLRDLASLVSYQTLELGVCDSAILPPALAPGHAISATNPQLGQEMEIEFLAGKPVVVYHEATRNRIVAAFASVALPTQSSDWRTLDLASPGVSFGELDATIVDDRLWCIYARDLAVHFARALVAMPTALSDFQVMQIDRDTGSPSYPTICNQNGKLALAYRYQNAGFVALPLVAEPSVSDDWMLQKAVSPNYVLRDLQMFYAGGRFSLAYVRTTPFLRLQLNQATVANPNHLDQWTVNVIGDPIAAVETYQLLAQGSRWLCFTHEIHTDEVTYMTHPSLYPTPQAGWTDPIRLTESFTVASGQKMELLELDATGHLLLLFSRSPVATPAASTLWYASLEGDPPYAPCAMRIGQLDTRPGTGLGMSAARWGSTWGLLQRTDFGQGEHLEVSVQPF